MISPTLGFCPSIGELQGEPAHLDVLAAHPVLDRPADRRAHFQGLDVAVDADELFTQDLLQPRGERWRASSPLLTITSCA